LLAEVARVAEEEDRPVAEEEAVEGEAQEDVEVEADFKIHNMLHIDTTHSLYHF